MALISSSYPDLAQTLVEAGAEDTSGKYSQLIQQELHSSLQFIHEITSNYGLEAPETIELISNYNTKYRAINKEIVFEEAKEMGININNVIVLTDLLKSTVSEKEKLIDANYEEIKRLREETDKLSIELRNLRGIHNILQPIIEEFSTNEQFVAFKNKYKKKAQAKVEEMSEDEVLAFWNFAQLPNQIIKNHAIKSEELEDMLDFHLESDLGMSKLRLRKRYFSKLSLFQHGQLLKIGYKKTKEKLFAPSYHKQKCSVCRQDTHAKFKLFLQEHECEDLFDHDLLESLGLCGEEMVHMTHEDVGKYLKVPRTITKRVKEVIGRWKEIHETVLHD